MESQKLKTQKLKCCVLRPKSQKFPTAENTRYTVLVGFFYVPVHTPTWGQPLYDYSEKPPRFSRFYEAILAPMRAWVLSRECVLRIPSVIVKGD